MIAEEVVTQQADFDAAFSRFTESMHENAAAFIVSPDKGLQFDGCLGRATELDSVLQGLVPPQFDPAIALKFLQGTAHISLRNLRT